MVKWLCQCILDGQDYNAKVRSVVDFKDTFWLIALCLSVLLNLGLKS